MRLYFNKSYLFCCTRFVWEEEIRLRIPNVPVTGIYVLTKTNEQFIDPAVLITSYDLMSKKKDMLLNLNFEFIIFVRSEILVYRIVSYFEKKNILCFFYCFF